MKRLFILMVCSSISLLANAGDFSGTIVGTSVFQGKGQVRIEGTPAGGENHCAQSFDKRVYWFWLSQDEGKAMFSLALAAKTSGQPVWVSGANECANTVYGVQGERLVAIDSK